jgi:hypothetical protein
VSSGRAIGHHVRLLGKCHGHGSRREAPARCFPWRCGGGSRRAYLRCADNPVTKIGRNCKSYVRNLGNVLARVVITLIVALTSGGVYYNVGAKSHPFLFFYILGAIVYNIIAAILIPFGAIANFQYVDHPIDVNFLST